MNSVPGKGEGAGENEQHNPLRGTGLVGHLIEMYEPLQTFRSTASI